MLSTKRWNIHAPVQFQFSSSISDLDQGATSVIKHPLSAFSSSLVLCVSIINSLNRGAYDTCAGLSNALVLCLRKSSSMGRIQGSHLPWSELITDQVMLWRCWLMLGTDILRLLRSWQTCKIINSGTIARGLFVRSGLICISHRLVAMRNCMETKCYVFLCDPVTNQTCVR